MYCYYARAAMKWETWWKRYITMFQILQFMTSFGLLVVMLSGVFGKVDQCSGGYALAANAAFNASLLYLFFGVLGTGKKPTRSKGA